MLAYYAFHPNDVMQRNMTIKAYPCNNPLCMNPDHLFLCEDKKIRMKELESLGYKGKECIRRSQVSFALFSLLSLSSLSLSLYLFSLSFLSLFSLFSISILYFLFSLIISYYLLFSLYSISMLLSHRLFFALSLLQMALARKAIEREDKDLTIDMLTAMTNISQYASMNKEKIRDNKR